MVRIVNDLKQIVQGALPGGIKFSYCDEKGAKYVGTIGPSSYKGQTFIPCVITNPLNGIGKGTLKLAKAKIGEEFVLVDGTGNIYREASDGGMQISGEGIYGVYTKMGQLTPEQMCIFSTKLDKAAIESGKNDEQEAATKKITNQVGGQKIPPKNNKEETGWGTGQNMRDSIRDTKEAIENN